MLATDIEWIKTLITATAGLFAGIVAEPVKATVAERLKIRKISRVLHREIIRLEGAITHGTQSVDPDNPAEMMDLFITLRPEAYDKFYETDRGLFYTDDRLSGMRQVFENIFACQQRVRSSFYPLATGRQEALNEVADGIRSGIFSLKAVKYYRSRATTTDSALIGAAIERMRSDPKA